MSLLQVHNPFDDALIAEIPYSTPAEIQRCLAHATRAFSFWRQSLSWQRSELLLRVASKLREDKEAFAQLITKEVGKPISLSRLEVDRGINVLEWASSEALRLGGELLNLDTHPSGRSGFGIVKRFPKGPILGITPFNFPLNLVLHKIAPAIASGCSIIIKPSPFAPLTAIKLASLFEIDEEKDLVQVLLAPDSEMERLTQSKEISHLSFTGSAGVGRQIQKQSPHCPTTLELGGNAWVIIMEDLDPSLYTKVASKIAMGAFGYAGQSCISIQNIAIARSIWKDFFRELASATEKFPFGDPSFERVLCGPLIHKQSTERVQSLLSTVCPIQSSHLLGSVSSVFPPSLLDFTSGPPRESLKDQLFQQELFAPVANTVTFSSLEELIQQINSSSYGLQCGVYTQNLSVIDTLFQSLDVGGLVVNDNPTTRYDHQPYGGVKESGRGREGVKYAVDEFTEAKFLALSSVIL